MPSESQTTQHRGRQEQLQVSEQFRVTAIESEIGARVFAQQGKQAGVQENQYDICNQETREKRTPNASLSATQRDPELVRPTERRQYSAEHATMIYAEDMPCNVPLDSNGKSTNDAEIRLTDVIHAASIVAKASVCAAMAVESRCQRPCGD